MADMAIARQDVAGMTPVASSDVVAQVAAIQDVMSKVMHDGTHYGRIPGCGDKPSLLKPGAEKLCMMFRLAPSYEIDRRDLDGGHREYDVTCTLSSIETGQVVAQGVGSCSTMESKYRYRADWSHRVGNRPGRIENPDIADTYNTVLKMAKKRAMVDATLSATAASDIFTQDIEDFRDVLDVGNSVVVTDAMQQMPSPQPMAPAPAVCEPTPAPVAPSAKRRLWQAMNAYSRKAGVPMMDVMQGVGERFACPLKDDGTPDLTRLSDDQMTMAALDFEQADVVEGDEF